MQKMVKKEAKHIDLIKHLCDELQEKTTKASCLSKELKQTNQQLLEVDQWISSLQLDRDKITFEVAEEKRKNVTAAANFGPLRDELAWYKVGEEEWWEARKKEFLKSSEFHELLGESASFLFDCGFTRAVRQFKKVGYLQDGAPIDFLDSDVALAEIPQFI